MVLVVDAQEARRKDLVRALAGFSYEVIAAADSEEGERFATGLHPGVIVAGAELDGFGDAAILTALGEGDGEEAAAAAPRLVLLAAADEPEHELPDEVIYLPVAGLTGTAVVRKLRTLLVAMEIGVATDARLESLIGDLHVLPLFELLQALQRAVVTGRLLTGDAELMLSEGELIGGRLGRARGMKAISRLARTAGGSFRLLLTPVGGQREITEDLLTVMAEALEDQAKFEEARAQLPDLASRARVEMGPAFFATNFNPSQQKLLESMQKRKSVWALLDLQEASDGQVLDDLLRLHTLGFVRFEEPEINVKVVTDSTSDLPPEMAMRHGIHVIPLSVLFGKEMFKDGVDITPGTFYKMLQSRKDVHPHTNPPTKGEFITGYQLLAQRGDIVSVHISAKLSKTVDNARVATEEGTEAFAAARPDGTAPGFAVVDSTQVSIALGMMAVFAARMARRGLPAADIGARLETMRDRFQLLFVVDTLEFLARGGRIGKAQAFLGGMFGIKPILGVSKGEVVPVDRVRGGKAAHPRLVELFKERVDAEQPVVVALAHANAPVWGERLKSLLEQSFKIHELISSEIGPVVGAHAGPGTVGACLFQPTEDELPLVSPLPVAE